MIELLRAGAVVDDEVAVVLERNNPMLSQDVQGKVNKVQERKMLFEIFVELLAQFSFSSFAYSRIRAGKNSRVVALQVPVVSSRSDMY